MILPRNVNFSILVFLFLQGAYAQMWLVDPLEPIYPDKNDLSGYSNTWRTDFPLGTQADVHVLLKIEKGENITLAAELNGELLDTSYWAHLLDVPVEQNTGLDSRTEQFIHKKNPYVVRRTPFRIFEVIKPLNKQPVEVKTDYSAFRLSIPSSIINKPGTYNFRIKVYSRAESFLGKFIVKVHPPRLPDLKESQFFYTNWFSLTNIEEYHDLRRWSKPWYTMMDKYAQLMAHGRQNSITLPAELIHFEKDEVVLEDAKMLAFINIFKKYGIKYFEAPHLMYRGENDDWGDPELKVILTKKRYYKENGKGDIEKLMIRIREFTTQNNLTNSWLQHIADEPTEVNADCYKDVVKQVKRIFPEAKIMEATNDRDGIAGAIDIWCPLINDFQENESFFREREKKGEKVLVYTCLIPGGKWLNRTLDMEKLRQVYFGWGAAFYNTGGYLHWGLNHYKADPFKQSVVKHPSPAASANNYLPAGDTHIIYPGKEGPLSSIRFESHRLGCEDYELLYSLKSIKKTKHDKLVNKLFRSYTDYNLDIKKYRKTRKKLFRSLP